MIAPSHKHVQKIDCRRIAFPISSLLFLAWVIALASLLVAPPGANASDEIPGAKQTGPIALVGGTIHPVAAPTVEKGTLLFDEGRIVALGKKVKLPARTKEINISGKHVYPGLIDSYGQLGLIEIDGVRATRDLTETGPLNPNAHALVAVNPDSELIPVTRANGVLISLSAPTGRFIAGTATLIQLDGWTWEDMTVRSAAGLHILWPSIDGNRGGRRGRRGGEEEGDRLKELADYFANAEAYRKLRAAEPSAPRDPRFEAMLPVLAGELPILAEADDLAQIESAVTFAAERKLKLVIIGGYDAERCADLLKRHDVSVILPETYRLPKNDSEDYDAPYTLPARLKKAGVRFAIAAGGRFAASNSRNLPYQAGNAVAYGLDRDSALKSITLWPAEILGVADRLGSLEAGKDATILVTSGDPLEAATQIESAYIQGRAVDLSSRHTKLYEKYEKKYEQLKKESGKAG